MTIEESLSWPFFAEHHRAFAAALARWADDTLPGLPHGERSDEVDAACRARVKALGEAGFLKAVVGAEQGGLHSGLDVRTLCLAREVLAARDGLADFAFAMQGLGTGAISLFGSAALKERYLPAVRDGRAIAAFALSEPEAGSDVAAIAATAIPDGASHARISGIKTWISNGGIADHYVVFARSGQAPGAKGLSAFVVDADSPGLNVAERIEVIAPHPLATLRFNAVRVPLGNRLGLEGEGFKVAMATLDIFRATVGAAALGFARRALQESVSRAARRKLFGAPLGELQLTQAAIAESASEVDASALLVYRAAWTKDQGAARVTREAAMAKMFATEAAQRVIDRAVQIHGGLGVTKGAVVERLYREIRALRIYEGATEVQKVVIARDLLKTEAKPAALAE
ncbi:MAG TPA: acyl-CoA dehydrogenase family protein [Xanthobacteraceae bacterium]|jgi:acyl-CoA dehydrogenase